MGNVAAFVALFALPFLPFPSRLMWLAIFSSVILHVGYKLALARSYVLSGPKAAFFIASAFQTAPIAIVSRHPRKKPTT